MEDRIAETSKKLLHEYVKDMSAVEATYAISSLGFFCFMALVSRVGAIRVSESLKDLANQIENLRSAPTKH